MKIKYIKEILDKINQIEKILVQIQTPKEEEFAYLTKIINEVENKIYFLGNNEDIDVASTLKKVFVYIERYPYQFFIFKHLIFEILLNFESLYNLYNTNDIEKIKGLRDKLNVNIFDLKKEFEIINKNKNYYYINFTLDRNIPYFYLSRRNILSRLKEYGKPYNYIPLSLDDDRYTYFILDFKIENNIDVLSLLEEIKNDDEAILDYKINKLENHKNIYNVKLYLDKTNNETYINISEKINKEILLDIIHYENMYDIYLYAKNQLEILNIINSINNEKIYFVLSKNINNRETKGIAVNGINVNNVEKIRKLISITMLDKKILDILYRDFVDFIGKQFLEYLKENYNIENGKYIV
ncbi:hypothetical protein [Streptobacillus moniliformis]|uniref:Uncharacterized protein n=1 Tax=Streptobacillus moniliformis (strain ATCC 14647 / DSM 12112 / NCTC 10651 / 9901) TaxID=519441 RepID=D1AXP6_STRM9|nr:hypothetical protein [Streptobacillus moniliformis]ACZ01072.1 hypothetical protein Smon_0594 [Streptobacillus moniliformis DSM 12112]AVL42562.1 hypothetical protein CEP89_01195 [Streptobacillus moniliformis]QXW65844.1 hypothetical protein KX935_00865 [Streptobacillus moniliformis]SQA13786.1 Uncharacterised protein [Streptobacillus moniliformis]